MNKDQSRPSVVSPEHQSALRAEERRPQTETPVTSTPKNARRPATHRASGTKRVVMFSGGIGSWGAAKRVVKCFGTRDLTLLFTDTCMEDEDLHRFLHEAAENIGGELVILRDGRSPWDVYRDRRFIGNSKVAPCSEELKREL